MRIAKPVLFMHETTGEIVRTKRSKAHLLPPEYKEIKFTTNSEGEKVVRLVQKDKDGNSVTVDISEVEIEVDPNGDGQAEILHS